MDSPVVDADICPQAVTLNTANTIIQRMDHLLTSAVVGTIDTGHASSSRGFLRLAATLDAPACLRTLPYLLLHHGIGRRRREHLFQNRQRPPRRREVDNFLAMFREPAQESRQLLIRLGVAMRNIC